MKKKCAFLLPEEFLEKLYCREDQARIVSAFDLVGPASGLKDLSARIDGVEVLFSGWGVGPFTREQLSIFPDLKIILYAGGSIRGVVDEEFWMSGVQISTSVTANAVPVVEFTIAQIVLAAKSAWQMSADVRRMRSHALRFEPLGLFGITVGLISLGAIGGMVAQKLREFDVSVICYDPTVSAADAAELGVTLVELDELFASSEIVSCHAPLIESTEGMLRTQHFEQMKPGATFINTARGGLVQGEDLIETLSHRPDIMAILDVTDPEPPDYDSAYYQLPNVVLTPHIAGSMGNECFRMGRYMVEDAIRYNSGLPLRYQVTHQQSLVMA